MLNRKLMISSIKILTWLIFIVYLLLLVYVILLKDGSAISMAKHREDISLSQRIFGINFVPLRTIIPYLKGEPSMRIAFENLLGNIIAFSPLGFLLPILFCRCEKVRNTFWVSFGTSLLIELLQFVFYLGSCDIDDIILNTLGSLLGFGVYNLFKSFYRKKAEVIT